MSDKINDMFNMDDDPEDNGFFLFYKTKIQSCLYTVLIDGKEYFGIIQCFSDVGKVTGGLITNVVPARRSGIKRSHNSQKALWERYNKIVAITTNRDGFSYKWEGYSIWNSKEIPIEFAFESAGSVVVWLN